MTRDERMNAAWAVPPWGPPKARDMQVGAAHYVKHKVQPWDAMEVWMSPEQFKGFLRGNVIKYIARCDDKGGVEDMKKAQHYLTKLIEVSDGNV